MRAALGLGAGGAGAIAPTGRLSLVARARCVALCEKRSLVSAGKSRCWVSMGRPLTGPVQEGTLPIDWKG